ncbi:hypothetical protein SCHPADRAFT_817415 [Schizopora paradoxa]|uniref:3-keto sterol reductase n=1 Tax=Schizopora paradoxa TaxID=27342 RepID=A0A0H2SDD5_9AGAM|nr:hypothetical protein SCHPADRAFT_817415 [Schizopora paradoxa]
MTSLRVKPIVIVTGANGGVGFAVCERLLLQLLQKTPPDSLPQPFVARKLYPNYPRDAPTVDTSSFGHDGITVIMACRSRKKAESAKRELLRKVHEEIAKLEQLKSYDGHAERFKTNFEVVVEELDLADMKSVFAFTNTIGSKYPYVSHIVCNAGVVSLTGYDWLLCIKQCCTEPIVALTSPLFKLQTVGELSVDQVGYVFQCNVFGHYVLYRELQNLLKRYYSLSNNPARVLWTSSIEAVPSCYDSKDWQLLKNDHSYEATKYQMDLLVGTFEARQEDASDPLIRHLLEHPGVVKTNILTSSVNNFILEALAQMLFYLVRFLGSRNHVISTYKAAVSAVHLLLVPLAFITTTGKGKTPLKFAAQSTRSGQEYVDADTVHDWESRAPDGEDLLDKCEALYQKFLAENPSS